MELTYLTKAPAGATHFMRYASGYIIWCKLEEGDNDQLVLKEWDSGNEYWVPGIHSVDFYQSIGLHSIDDFIVTMPAVDLTAAPKGATHCYNHGGQVSWYRESDSGLHVWRDGSWYTSAHKSAAELAKICPLGCIAEIVPVVGDVEAATVAAESEDDLTWLARTEHHWPKDAVYVSRRENAVEWHYVELSFIGYGHFTRDQWLKRRADLQNKPSWKDAPEWAEWLCQNDIVGVWWWAENKPEPYPKTNMGAWKFKGRMEQSLTGEALGDWRDTLERRPEKPRAELEVELANVASHRVDDKPNTDFLARAADYHRLRDACRIMRDNPDGCTTEAVDALYKVSRELLTQRKALPEWAEQTAEHHAPSGLAVEVISTLKKTPTYFTAGELMEIHQLVDAELTKRDAAVCGGKKYLDAHWFERGELPPVGVDCQVYAYGCWVDAYVVGFTKKGAIVVDVRPFQSGVKGGLRSVAREATLFRPISEHDELIDVLKGTHAASLTNLDMLASAILAAGFKRDGGAA